MSSSAAKPIAATANARDEELGLPPVVAPAEQTDVIWVRGSVGFALVVAGTSIGQAVQIVGRLVVGNQDDTRQLLFWIGAAALVSLFVLIAVNSQWIKHRVMACVPSFLQRIDDIPVGGAKRDLEAQIPLQGKSIRKRLKYKLVHPIQ
jgi:hypothetical protein